MPIRTSNAPHDITTKVADDLGALARTRGEASLFEDTGGGLTSPVASLPVYGIARTALEHGGDAALAAAEQIGWRYLIQDGEGTGLVDHFGTVAGGSSRVMRGPSVERYGKAGLVAEAEAPKDTAFEPRVLDFGVLGQTELWLHSPDAEDRFYSLGAAEPARRDAAAVMAEALSRAARQSLSEHEEQSGEAGSNHDGHGGSVVRAADAG